MDDGDRGPAGVGPARAGAGAGGVVVVVMVVVMVMVKVMAGRPVRRLLQLQPDLDDVERRDDEPRDQARGAPGYDDLESGSLCVIRGEVGRIVSRNSDAT